MTFHEIAKKLSNINDPDVILHELRSIARNERSRCVDVCQQELISDGNTRDCIAAIRELEDEE